MRHVYWNGVTATLVWFGVGIAALGVATPAGSPLGFLLAGGGIVFFTLQAYYLIRGGHVEIRFSIPEGQYPWMARLWVGFLTVATLLFGVLVGRSWSDSELPAVALLIMAGIPAGGTLIMLATALRLRR